MKISMSKDGLPADFYIARVGSRAGQPLKCAYTGKNCFAVTSDNPDQDFAKAMAAYVAGAYREYTYGTAQKFIRLRDARAVIAKADQVEAADLLALKKAMFAIEAMENQIARLEQLKKQAGAAAYYRRGQAFDKIGYIDVLIAVADAIGFDQLLADALADKVESMTDHEINEAITALRR